MQDGVIVPFGTARTQVKVMHRLCELIQKRIGRGGQIKVAFSHVAAVEQMNALKELVCSQFRCSEILTNSLSPALAVHSGPGTIGLSFYPLS
jgi:fatty acid-binding protein DegV